MQYGAVVSFATSEGACVLSFDSAVLVAAPGRKKTRMGTSKRTCRSCSFKDVRTVFRANSHLPILTRNEPFFVKIIGLDPVSFAASQETSG